MLESLPNEVILNIFSFLDLTDLHRAFSSLNIRFECLLHDRSESLTARLTPPLAFPIDEFASRILHLSMIDWSPDDLLALLQPSIFPQLLYLNVTSSSHLYFGSPTNNLIHRILSLPTIRSCEIQLSPTLYVIHGCLPSSASIVHLKLSMITLDMLFHLLMQTPNLRSIHVWLNSNGRVFDPNTYDPHYCCLHLTKLTLGLHNDIKFSEVLFLLPRMPVLRSLSLNGSVWDDNFLQADHWRGILTGQGLYPLLHRLNVDLSIRWAESRPPSNMQLARFTRSIFRQAAFSVVYDQSHWIYIRCRWKS